MRTKEEIRAELDGLYHRRDNTGFEYTRYMWGDSVSLDGQFSLPQLKHIVGLLEEMENAS